MKKILYIYCLFGFLKASVAFAGELEAGKWNFILADSYCYIGSYPIETEIPEGKKRDQAYILVYRMNNSEDAIIQVEAGYPYDSKKSVEVTIDKKLYNFVSDEGSAWTENDIKVISSMKKGLVLSVKGQSSRGTKTKDTYSLKGFTAAYNKLFKDC